MSNPPFVQQNEAELTRLLDLYEQRQPMRTLELGVGQGGTLYYWLTRAPDYALVVAVDDQHLNRGSYRGWLDDDAKHVELVELTGLTSTPAILEAAAAYSPYDWLFIDADHRFAAVSDDWSSYGALVRPGGVVAFHDIKPSQDPNVGVDQLWAELRTSERTVEWIEPAGGFGIGVVFTRQAAPDPSPIA